MMNLPIIFPEQVEPLRPPLPTDPPHVYGRFRDIHGIEHVAIDTRLEPIALRNEIA